MKADSKELARDSSANADQTLGDPFAVDLFAPESASFETSAASFTTPLVERLEPHSLHHSWNLRLPRVKRDQVEASAALAGLPLETYSQIQSSVVSVLSRYSMNSPEQITVSLVELHEMDFAAETSESDVLPGVFATFIGEANATAISFELGAAFASSLVDRMLGGDGAPPDSLRSLTRTERAVIEFLCLSAVSELNSQIGEPLLRLQTLSEQPPWWTSRSHKATALTRGVWQRGLAVSLRVGVGDITGIIWAYLSASALSALAESNRRLRAAQQTSKVVSYTGEEFARYERVAPDLGLTMLIGKSYVTPEELLDLESGDVMVVERPSIRWRDQRIRGSVLLRVGDADEALLSGHVSETTNLEQSAAEANPHETSRAGSLKMKVGAVSISPPPTLAERVKMEEEAEGTEAPAEGASLIEAVMLTVHVELAARRLRLDELSRLRVNQILDLECQATDPVDLLVDSRRIAQGELVDIEGRLGVRITQVLA